MGSIATDCDVPVLLNIRKSDELLNLRAFVLSGLTAESKTLPSLLLWDDKGLQNFNEWTMSPDYYPRARELEIIDTYKDAMAEDLPQKFAMIELGCGNLYKTASILTALAQKGREVHYYALDVSSEALSNSLNELKMHLQGHLTVKISGIIGTYEDCVDWLTDSTALDRLGISHVNFLWVGNTVANLQQSEASALLGRFREGCKAVGLACSFLISADCCSNKERLIKAYDPNNEPARTFMIHPLHHANMLLGQEAFQMQDWDCALEYDTAENELLFWYSPKGKVTLEIGQQSIQLSPETKVLFWRSGKWTHAQVERVAIDAGFNAARSWKDKVGEYSFYLLNSM